MIESGRESQYCLVNDGARPQTLGLAAFFLTVLKNQQRVGLETISLMSNLAPQPGVEKSPTTCYSNSILLLYSDTISPGEAQMAASVVPLDQREERSGEGSSRAEDLRIENTENED
jgi:hypothetical protein